MADELAVVAVDDPPAVLLVRLDEPDTVAEVFVPGTGGASPADITAAVEAHRADPDAHPSYATTDYVDLQVATGGDLAAVETLIDEALATHAQAAEPHPAYDTEAPTFSLIFANGLV